MRRIEGGHMTGVKGGYLGKILKGRVILKTLADFLFCNEEKAKTDMK